MTPRFGLIGCGAMGTTIAEAFDSGEIRGELASVYDVDGEKAEKLAVSLQTPPAVAPSFDELLDSCDFVVEAASQDAVREYATKVLTAGKDLLVMSVGALLDEVVMDAVKDAAESGSATLYLPSGALAGVDGLLAASVAGVEEVTLTTTKPPAGLKGIPYLRDRGVDVSAVSEPTVVFEGGAGDAVKLFQRNINVSAIASIAAGKPATVRIIADPAAETNTHTITAKGPFGELTTTTSNVPSPTNPKTSYLACLSAIAVLKKVCGRVKVG